MKQIHRSRLLSSGLAAVAISIGALLSGAVGATTQTEQEAKTAKAELTAQQAAEAKALKAQKAAEAKEKKAQKAAEAKALKAQKAAEAKAKKAEKAQIAAEKKAKTTTPAKAKVADTPKGTYLPGQFTEQERKAAPAAEVKQF